MECQLLMASCVRMAHYTPTILTSEWSQYPDNQNTTTISTSVTFWHHSLRLTGSSSTSLRHKSNRKKTHNGQTFWADIKYQRVKYLVLSWNVSKTWQLDAGIVGAQRTLSGSHEERRSRGFDNPGDNIPSSLSILLSTKSEVCSLMASQSEQTLAITFSCPIMPHLVMTNFVTTRKFRGKERLSWARGRQSITCHWLVMVGGGGLGAVTRPR